MGGPVGRTAAAETDAQLHAEVLTWSRARGLFAGIALEGSTLRPDKDDNTALYGHEVSQREILRGDVKPPAATDSLYAALNRHSSPSEADREKR
jgi:lipid-binding SYLF domain-containing protein